MAGRSGGAAVTIERCARDLLHGHLRGLLGRLDEIDTAIESGDVDRAVELRDLAVFAFSLFEELGWGTIDERLVYRLPLDRRVLPWLHEIRAAELADFNHDRLVLEGQQAGNVELCYCGYSLQESVSITRGYIARTLADLETIDGLLAQVCAPASDARRPRARVETIASVEPLERWRP